MILSKYSLRLNDTLKRGEDILALTIVSGLVLFPALEALSRLFRSTGIPASPVLVQHLTLWIGFIGAVLAARQNKLLALSTTPLFQPEKKIHPGRWLAKTVSFIILIALTWGSLELVKIEYQYPVNIAPYIPRWAAMVIMPIGFSLIALQIIRSSYQKWFYRGTMLAAALIWLMVAATGTLQGFTPFLWAGVAILLLSLFFGAPIFVGLGGIAVLFFWSDFTPISSISAETYRIVVSPTLPTIPLFTLAGYLLAESGASHRMVVLFRTLFGWIPGGTPVVIVILSGFFTALTGGSGVTILALGGLLYPLLIKEGYSKTFALGLITVAGSLGLLFPPSLPAIIYGITAGVSVKDIFIGGLIPGTLLVILVAGWAIYQGKHQAVRKHEFNFKQILDVLWKSRWEILIPFIILFGIFGGFTTLVETAAIAVLYIIIIEIFVYKDLSVKALPGIIINCTTLIGGVLIILGVAMGLTSYLVDAQVPTQLLIWVKSAVHSKYTFLIMLNIFLLIVGSLMDIFSAIIVVAPLIAPLGIYFGIDPVHLAIIFIANLELGFLTPPVGMNLFLAAYRFDEDMPTIYKATLPFFLVRIIAVLAITYLPILSLALLP
ncbi:MAG: TRAP transporter large permease subunit [Candidatus Neomarinimicrobiota bacterium]